MNQKPYSEIISPVRIRGYSKSQILQKFQVHCQTLAANDNAGYREEFEELEAVGRDYTCRAGQLEANKRKNRYPFILPYDHSRVQLSLLESKLHSDYINANYVPGGTSEHDFICTQAPLQSTMVDFWRMIWEKNVAIIVMVTALRDDGKVMCDQYWPPERGTGCYGTIQVTTISRQRAPEYYITTIRLQQGFQTVRQVTHYHYPVWPDQGVPETPVSLCAFTEQVRRHLDNITSHGPTVVHCSAGVGRSGTFVALLWLIQLCARGIPPNVRLAVQDLRKHRVMMVQNLEQYILVHQCLHRWLGGETSRPRYSSNVAKAPLQPAVHYGPRQSTRSRRVGPKPPERTPPTDQPQQRKQTHQQNITHSSKQTSSTVQPQQTKLQSLQTALKTMHPGNLLRRIMPSSTT